MRTIFFGGMSMKQKILSHFVLWGLATTVAVACRPATSGSCDGGKTAATGAAGKTSVVGGYIYLTRDIVSLQPQAGSTAVENTSREVKRCTAIFDFGLPQNSSNSRKKAVRVYTAAHCSGGSLDDVVSTEIDVWAGDGYVRVPITLDEVEKYQKAGQQLTAAGYSQTEWGPVLRKRITFPTEVTESTCVPLSSMASSEGNSNSQNLCFSWVDLAVFEASIDASVYQTHKAVLPAVSVSAQSGSNLLAFSENHRKLMRLAYERLAATQVDVYHACLAGEGSSCYQHVIDMRREALSNHVFIDGVPALEAAQKAGVTNSSSSFAEIKIAEFKDVFNQMKTQWEGLRNENFSVLTNTVAPAELFVAQPLTALGQGLRFSQEPTGLRIFVPSTSATLRFFEGDSGSLVVANGRAPVMTLQSVNDQETSGGASLAPLPRRSGSQSSSNLSTSNSANPCN
jgi:hypothetical protein